MTDHRPVLVVGVFDLFHRGHVELLRVARTYGSSLCVIVNGDELTSSYKRKPVFSEADRLAIVEACRFVDVALISNSYDVKPIVEQYGIRIIVHGDDWPHEKYLEQIRVSPSYLETHGIEMVYTPYYQGESTSSIIRRVKEAPA